jgi:succinyl-diaminopimelate desuccinylase
VKGRLTGTARAPVGELVFSISKANAPPLRAADVTLTLTDGNLTINNNINAGTGAPNVIPGELKARFNLRYNPVQTQQQLRATVEEILDRHQVRYTIDWYVSGEPFYTPPGPLSAAVTTAVGATIGREPVMSTGGGTSDGRFIATLGTQVVELGVTNASIHKVNESVAVAEIEALHDMYVGVLRQLLGKPANA